MRVAQNFAMIANVASVLVLFTVKEWSWWWMLLFVPMFIAMYWADPHMVRGESNYQNDNNPQFKELCESIKNIEEAVNAK